MNVDCRGQLQATIPNSGPDRIHGYDSRWSVEIKSRCLHNTSLMRDHYTNILDSVMRTEQVGLTSPLQTCNREFLGSNPGQGFRGYPEPPSSSIRQHHFPSKYLPSHHSSCHPKLKRLDVEILLKFPSQYKDLKNVNDILYTPSDWPTHLTRGEFRCNPVPIYTPFRVAHTVLHILMECLCCNEKFPSCKIHGTLRDIIGDHRHSVSNVMAYLMYVSQNPFNWQNSVHL
jgi:hypothetical protein